MCVRRSSRSTAIRPVCGTRSSRCWCLYCFNVCWAGSAVFFTAKKISDETRNIDLTKYKRRRHEERTRPAAPHSLQHRSVSSVGSQPISHTPAHEPDVTWRCETGFNPSLSRPTRIQFVSATLVFGWLVFDITLPSSRYQTSLGVSQSRTFMGVSLISSTMACRSSSVRSSKLVLLGR